MNIVKPATRSSRVVTVTVMAACLLFAAGNASARAWIDGINGQTSLNFAAGAGEVSSADGGAIHFWGYQDLGNNEGVGLPQYPGPTIILNQGDAVTLTLSSNLPFSRCTSIVFPGHSVTVAPGTGDQDGALTRETCPGGAPVTYTFTASQPGTYTYYSGTDSELQVEMGLMGAIIVRPASPVQAYNSTETSFDHEVLFLLTSIDPTIHQLAEQNRFDEIDLATRWPVYWFINGRSAPDDLGPAFVPYLPHQPYNCTPRITPGQTILVRIIGGDMDQHPLHLHGNHFYEIARDGRLLSSDGANPDLRRGKFTSLSIPGQTVDALFSWTGEKLGWDIYGHGAGDPLQPNEYAPDHGKPFPVTLPENQSLAFGGWWSGSPFMGGAGNLPPGEGGLNPYGGFFFMWHSHAEKELTNFDIFPGGMMSMMVVEPPGTIIGTP